MGLLNKLLGGGSASKEDLIRNLVKKRINEDPLAGSMGINTSMIDTLDTLQLMGIPESTIVTIVETYALSLKSGASVGTILNHIENHRSQIGSGSLPDPLNLESYIKYRLGIEHGHGAVISEKFISNTIAASREYFGC